MDDEEGSFLKMELIRGFESNAPSRPLSDPSVRHSFGPRTSCLDPFRPSLPSSFSRDGQTESDDANSDGGRGGFSLCKPARIERRDGVRLAREIEAEKFGGQLAHLLEPRFTNGQNAVRQDAGVAFFRGDPPATMSAAGR